MRGLQDCRRRRSWSIAVGLACGVAATLLLPGSAQPVRVASHRAAAQGTFAVTKIGPALITINPCCAPARFDYTITIQYTGPPLTAPLRITFTDRLPSQVLNPGMNAPTAHLSDCTFTAPGVPGPTVSCAAHFDESHRTNTFTISVRPTGETGIATNTIELSTGETATSTATIVDAPPPPPPPPPPAAPTPIPGPPAAPTRTVTETFTRPGEVEPQSAPIAPAAKTAQIALTWPAGSSFDVTGITLVPRASGRTLAAAERRRTRLKISKRRTATSLDVRIGRLKPGRLRFRIVARRVDGRTRVTARIRQSRRA